MNATVALETWIGPINALPAAAVLTKVAVLLFAAASGLNTPSDGGVHSWLLPGRAAIQVADSFLTVASVTTFPLPDNVTRIDSNPLPSGGRQMEIRSSSMGARANLQEQQQHMKPKVEKTPTKVPPREELEEVADVEKSKQEEEQVKHDMQPSFSRRCMVALARVLRVGDDSSTTIMVALLALTVIVNVGIVVFVFSQSRSPANSTAAQAATPVEKKDSPRAPVRGQGQDSSRLSVRGGRRRGPGSSSIATEEQTADAASEGNSETSAQFNARLEEITAQLAAMLKGPVQVVDPNKGGNDEEDWNYVACLSAPPNQASSHAKARGWRNGIVGCWTSMDAFMQGTQPMVQVPMLEIADMHQDAPCKDGEMTVTIVMSDAYREAQKSTNSRSDVTLRFRAEKEAALWASTLSALLEQLEDEEDM